MTHRRLLAVLVGLGATLAFGSGCFESDSLVADGAGVASAGAVVSSGPFVGASSVSAPVVEANDPSVPASTGGAYARGAPAPGASAATLFEAHPFLEDTSLWYGYASSSMPPRPRSVGEFGVGNGRAFALVGTSLPYHSFRNIIGPDYERDSKFFSDKDFQLKQGVLPIDVGSQWDMRVRKTPITLTRTNYLNGLELYTVDFAPRGGPVDDDWSERAIVRLFVARNKAGSLLRNLSIEVESPLGTLENGVHREHVDDAKNLAVRPWDGPFPDNGERMLIELPDLPADGEAVVGFLMAFTYDGEDEADVFEAITSQGWDSLLDETYTWWQSWYDGAATLTTPEPLFNDLLESLQVSIKVQQAYTGATCVMSEYTGTWTRDTIGPVRFFSPMGRGEDVRQMLDYQWLAILDRGGISNAYDSNIELETLPEQPDWEAMGTMTGRTGAEGPSYYPLMYGIYYDHTGDLARLEERYGMLKHAVEDQDFRHECLLPFSGDETFRDIMSVSNGNLVGLTLYEETWLSANSSFLFAAAADRMVEVAGLLEKTGDRDWFIAKAAEVRDCTEQYYWLPQRGYYSTMIDIDTLLPVTYPYEDVNTKPLWSGAESADDPHQIGNVLAVMEELRLEEGVIQSPIHPLYKRLLNSLGCYEGIMSGMSHAYWLENLTRIDHPEAEAAFNIWKRHFNDSGNVSEAMIRDDYTRIMYVKESYGLVSDLTSRYRPWEGGIHGAALLNYLTGFEADYPNRRIRFAPHMPDGWADVSFEGAPFGPYTLDTRVTDDGATRAFTVSNGSGAFDLELQLSVPGEISGLWIDGVAQDLAAFETSSSWGRSRVTVGPRAVRPGEMLTVEVSH